MNNRPRIVPLGEQAVVVEFGNTISEELNLQAIALAEHLKEHPITGFIEAVPAYASTTVFYDPLSFEKACGGATSFQTIASEIASAVELLTIADEDSNEVLEIPAIFNDDCGPDLKLIAEQRGLSTAEVVEVFTSATYRVFMIGFLPGFAYMGQVDERLSMPRKPQPRRSVPKGTIGIAGRQTGVYPMESPAGWQLIGRTDVEFFTPRAERPSLLQAGDRVRFLAV
jgi:inhibitor of KinA